jgi:hypothetical protein
MFAARHSDINSLKYGLLHLTGQSNSQKGKSAKAKMELFHKLAFWELYQLIDTHN